MQTRLKTALLSFSNDDVDGDKISDKLLTELFAANCRLLMIIWSNEA